MPNNTPTRTNRSFHQHFAVMRQGDFVLSPGLPMSRGYALRQIAALGFAVSIPQAIVHPGSSPSYHFSDNHTGHIQTKQCRDVRAGAIKRFLVPGFSVHHMVLTHQLRTEHHRNPSVNALAF